MITLLYAGYGLSLTVAIFGGTALLRDSVGLLAAPADSTRRRYAAAVIRASVIIASVTSLLATGWLFLTATMA